MDPSSDLFSEPAAGSAAELRAVRRLGERDRLIVALHKIFTVLVLGIGVVHAAGTFYFFGSLSEAAIWFAGAGLGAIFVALLNIGLWPRDVSLVSWRLAASANALFFIWLAMGFWATPGPPAALVAGTGLAMVVSALLLPHRKGT